MKFIHPDINHVSNLDDGYLHTLIVESPVFLRRLLFDIRAQMDGGHGDSVLSVDNKPVDMDRYAELLDVFIPFDINRKSLLTKICAALEKNAVRPEHYETTMCFMRDLEVFLDSLTFDFPCDIVFPKLSISGVIKGAAPELRDDYASLGEKILDYMELVTEFDRTKLFITVNLRCYLTDSEAELFAKTAISHGYQILMIETTAKSKLSIESRVIIDVDLCEIC